MRLLVPLAAAVLLAAACGSDVVQGPWDGLDASSAAPDDAGSPAPDAAATAAGADAAGVATDAGLARSDAGSSRDAAHSGPDAASPGPDAASVEPWSFVVMGDNQFATASCTSGVNERLAIPKAIVAANPTLVVHVGDLMDHGYEAGAYDKFKSCDADLLAKAPFFPVAGNHDLGSGAAVAFRSYLEEALLVTGPKVYGEAKWAQDFEVSYGDDPTAYSTNPSAPANRPDLPSGFSFKTFHAFRFRNAYFVGLESGTQWWTNTPKSWITKHLAAARADPSIEHVFVWLHHPLYSSTMPDDDSTQDSLVFVRNAYDAIFRQYGVTAVFSGHVHLYDRFYVPDDGHATRTASPPTSYPRTRDAIHHVTVGGAGGPLPSSCNPIPGERQETSNAFQQKRACGYHFLKVSVEGGKLTFDATQVQGSSTSYTTTAWDHFTVE
ncbi:MAG TPA: metallophosphoesterase [Myxococcales bacterium]|jgi:hypothetical protein